MFKTWGCSVGLQCAVVPELHLSTSGMVIFLLSPFLKQHHLPQFCAAYPRGEHLMDGLIFYSKLINLFAFWGGDLMD